MTNIDRLVASKNPLAPAEMSTRGPAEVPHNVFTVRPQSKDASVLRQMPVVEVPTRYLENMVANAIARADSRDQVRFFNKISNLPTMKGSSGYIFELFLRVRLMSSNSVPLSTIPKLSDSPKLEIPSTGNVIYLYGLTRMNEAHKHQLPFMWWPTTTNFASMDAIICTHQHIIFLSSTVSGHHDVNVEGLRAVISHIPSQFRKKRALCLVFVTINAQTAADLLKQDLKVSEHVEGLHVYSSVFKVGEEPMDESDLLCLNHVIVCDTTLTISKKTHCSLCRPSIRRLSRVRINWRKGLNLTTPMKMVCLIRLRCRLPYQPCKS